jgi:hypothetical protein
MRWTRSARLLSQSEGIGTLTCQLRPMGRQSNLLFASDHIHKVDRIGDIEGQVTG